MDAQLASFALDIPILLPAFGYVAGRLGKTKKTGYLLYGITLLGFWLIAGGLYFNFISIEFLPGGAGQGNHFMWNSGIEVLGANPLIVFPEPSYAHFWSAPNLLAMIAFAFVYPAILWFGFKKGRSSLA